MAAALTPQCLGKHWCGGCVVWLSQCWVGSGGYRGDVVVMVVMWWLWWSWVVVTLVVVMLVVVVVVQVMWLSR